MKKTAMALWRRVQSGRAGKESGPVTAKKAKGWRFLSVMALCLALALCLGACAPREHRPLTFEEQQDLEAYRQCKREATSMNPEWRGDTSYFPWRAYFDMCMRRMGVSDERMKQMRIWI
jgi:hypothetical protein